MHLLRYVFENAKNYTSAKKQLASNPITVPCIITLAGTEPNQGCVIEHTGEKAKIYPAPQTVANHWLTDGLKGHERDTKSRERAELMRKSNPNSKNGFHGWLKPPILNETTRFAGIMSPNTGNILIQGFEHGREATAPLSITV